MGCCCATPAESQPLLSQPPPKPVGPTEPKRKTILKHVETEVKNFEQRMSVAAAPSQPKTSVVVVNSGVSNKIAKWETGQTSSLQSSSAAPAATSTPTTASPQPETAKPQDPTNSSASLSQASPSVSITSAVTSGGAPPSTTSSTTTAAVPATQSASSAESAPAAAPVATAPPS